MRWNNKTKKFSLVLTGLLLLTACEQRPQDTPINGVGRLNIHERYYVDRVGVSRYEYRVNPYIEGGVPGAKIYWSLIDPDDPAADGTIDPNGLDGDDNGGKTSGFRDVYDEGNAVYSIVDHSGYTECYFDIQPKEVSGIREYYISGDNFKVKATRDSPDGDVYVESETFSVWKKIRKIEYDWMATPPEAVDPMDTDIFSQYWNLFSDLKAFFSDETKPNRLTYVEIENGSLINEDDSKDPDFHEPREISPLELEATGPWDDLVDEIDKIWKFHDDYVYIFSMSSCSDEPDCLGASRPISVDGGDGFSVIFLTTIKYKAKEKALSEYACVKKVLLHELGHQLVNLEDYGDFPGNHTDYDCIMRQSLESALVYDPHFCVGCVLNFRQYFKNF